MNNDSLVVSQKKLNLYLGGLAVGLPTFLFLGNYWFFGVQEELFSLSAYYYSGMGDVFVGVLFTIGFFFLTYEGYSFGERILSAIAGILIITVTLSPTTASGTSKGLTSYVHDFAAAAFFLILAYFSLFLFTKSEKDKPMTIRKQIRNLFYILSAILMILSLLAIVLAVSKIIKFPFENPIFWMEYVAISSFGMAWIIKGEGIFFLNDDPILKMKPWEVTGFIIIACLAVGSGIMLSLLVL